jgi:hypothetical protein
MKRLIVFTESVAEDGPKTVSNKNTVHNKNGLVLAEKTNFDPSHIFDPPLLERVPKQKRNASGTETES